MAAACVTRSACPVDAIERTARGSAELARELAGRRGFDWAVLGLGLLLLLSPRPMYATTTPPESPTLRIAELINQLGAAEFARRQRAQDELRQYGVVAFEALHAAQSHPDVEIRKQAEYLLHGIRIVWVQEDDPEDVKQLLRYYQQEESADRMLRLEQLGHLDHEAAYLLLCRLARFETSEVLSRRAALAVMRRRMAPGEVSDEQLRNLIAQVIGSSERTAPRWLSLYAQTLVDPASTVEAWQAATAIELAAIEKRPDKERIAVTRDFLRNRLEMLQAQGRDAEMLPVLQQLLPLQGGSVDEVLELADWLIDRRAWPMVERLVATYPALFDEDPHLGYRQAALQVHQGNPAAAEERIQKILALKDPDDGSLHIELGFDLQNRGQYDWAEREYRHAIASTEPGSYAAIEASYRLGYMFHDLSRHADAYAALKVIADLVQNDPEMMKRVQQLNHTRNRIFSQMHFSHALMLGEAKSYEAQQGELMNALKFDQENADILIAMHRVPEASVTWRDETRERIDRLREVYEQRVVSAEREMEALPGQLTSLNLAQQLNQLAWLIANTYGDFDAAIRYSRRSLELAPEQAGYLDTLGRCYYAARDYTNAVRYQRRAVELEPHSGQIRRQLEVFEQALAQAR